MNINNSDIVRNLRELADELKPFTQEIRAGARVWNGRAYVKAEPRKADSYALAWWSALTSIADMIDNQNEPLTSQQLEYLKKKIFGGMGSFIDFRIDEDIFGNLANKANERLDRKLNTFSNIFLLR